MAYVQARETSCGTTTDVELPAVMGRYTSAHHEEFMERGYLHLGPLLPPDELQALSARLDEAPTPLNISLSTADQLSSGPPYTVAAEDQRKRSYWAEQVMLGEVVYEGVTFQLDPGGS